MATTFRISIARSLRPQTQVRFKSTASPPPTGTFKPLHPLRGGPGVRPPPPPPTPEGKSSLSAIGNKAADYAQRAVVTCLFGMTVWGMWAMWDTHTKIMEKSKGRQPLIPILQLYEQHLRDGTLIPPPSGKPEIALAEAAQRISDAGTVPAAT